jgi:hypothetical protein
MRVNVVILGLSAVAVVIGAFMPWVTLGLLHASGTDGDGVITLILAILAGVLILVTANNVRPGLAFVVIIFGVLVTAVAGYDMANIQDKIHSSGNAFVSSASVGSGLYVTLLGGIGLAVGGVLGFFAKVPPVQVATDNVAQANHEHQWVDSEGQPFRRCEVCSLIEGVPHDHIWGDPLPSDKYAGRLYQRCSTCDAARYIN